MRQQRYGPGLSCGKPGDHVQVGSHEASGWARPWRVVPFQAGVATGSGPSLDDPGVPVNAGVVASKPWEPLDKGLERMWNRAGIKFETGSTPGGCRPEVCPLVWTGQRRCPGSSHPAPGPERLQTGVRGAQHPPG